MIRVLLKIATYLLFLLLFGILTLLFCMSDLGLKTAAKITEKFIPELSIQNISGSLYNHFVIDNLHYKNQHFSLVIHKLYISWNPLTLLEHQVQINQIISNDIKLILLNNSNQSSNFNYDLPLKINIDNILLTKLMISAAQVNNKLSPTPRKPIVTTFSKLQMNANGYHRNFSINIKQINGELMNKNFVGHADLKIEQENFYVHNLLFSMGKSFISANGFLNKLWNLRWTIKIPDFHEILPNSYGQLQSSGIISGDRWQPSITANLAAKELKIFNLNIGLLQGQTTANLAPQGKIDLDIHSQNLNYDKTALDSLHLNISGETRRHTIYINGTNQSNSFLLSFTGGYDHKQWLGDVHQLILSSRPQGEWQLTRTASARFAKNVIAVNNLCLTSHNKLICSNLQWNIQTGIVANMIGKNIDLDSLVSSHNIKSKNSVKLHGTIAWQAKLQTNQGGNLLGDAIVQLSPGSINFQNSDNLQSLNFNGGRLIAKINKQGLSATANIDLARQQNLIAQFKLPGYRNLKSDIKRQKILGTIDFNMQQLSWLSALVPQIQNTSGNLHLNMKIWGIVNHPILSGKINLSNGFTTIPSISVDLKRINIVGSGDPRGAINWQGSALAGKNFIFLTGRTDLSRSDIPTKLLLHGTQITLANTQEYKIIASPNVSLNYLNKAFTMTGIVNVNSASITSGNFSGGSVTLPDDVVFIDHTKKKKTTSSSIPFDAQLHVNLGNNVAINTSEFKGKLLGSLFLDYNPDAATTASGEINIVEGEYNAYGKNLTINVGNLQFTGGRINNPIVNIQATRIVHTTTQNNATLGNGFLQPVNFAEPGKVIVGVEITGPLKNYRVNLFSQPAVYSQSDILSLMLFDMTANQIGNSRSGSGQLLLSAASQLKLGGGQLTNITQQLQNTFGLDELGLGSESLYDPKSKSITPTTSFTIGKKIGNRLYLNYSIGIFDPISILTARYSLTPNWVVQTNASVLGKGVDMFYTVER